MASKNGGIPSHWREIQGENKWDGLLHPDLNIDLRQSLLVYGNLAAAANDAVEKDESSPHYGDCPFEKDSFFQKVYLEKGNPYKYEVTKYIYATSSFMPLWPFPKCKETCWMGYVAVTTEEGKKALGRIDVVVVWRGTITTDEWRDDKFAILVPYLELGSLIGLNGSMVHGGFLSVYTTANDQSPYDTDSARHQVLKEVRRLMDLYKDEKDVSITVTGHSLGGALTTLNSIDIVANGYNRPSDNPTKVIPVTAVGFACPRVGDLFFTANYDKMENLRFIKVRNRLDLVPNLPPHLPLPYSDCGVELLLDASLSPYLKDSVKDKEHAHNLELYLHGVAGTHWIDGTFDLVINRDIALVNKEIDGLLDKYNIPVGWWTGTEPKGMEQWDDGSWHPVKSEIEPTTESST